LLKSLIHSNSSTKKKRWSHQNKLQQVSKIKTRRARASGQKWRFSFTLNVLNFFFCYFHLLPTFQRESSASGRKQENEHWNKRQYRTFFAGKYLWLKDNNNWRRIQKKIKWSSKCFQLKLIFFSEIPFFFLFSLSNLTPFFYIRISVMK
jgi:hypothetical protein